MEKSILEIRKSKYNEMKGTDNWTLHFRYLVNHTEIIPYNFLMYILLTVYNMDDWSGHHDDDPNAKATKIKHPIYAFMDTKYFLQFLQHESSWRARAMLIFPNAESQGL